jgi:hypothetical protein
MAIKDYRQQRFWMGRERTPNQLERTEILSWNEYQYVMKQLRDFRINKYKGENIGH